MTLRFDSRQGLVLDQALACYLRKLEDVPAGQPLPDAERSDLAAQVRELQSALQRAFHPRRRDRQ